MAGNIGEEISIIIRFQGICWAYCFWGRIGNVEYFGCQWCQWCQWYKRPSLGDGYYSLCFRLVAIANIAPSPASLAGRLFFVAFFVSLFANHSN
jgi:hypothetical protein